MTFANFDPAEYKTSDIHMRTNGNVSLLMALLQASGQNGTLFNTHM